jgi:hypothetical protein
MIVKQNEWRALPEGLRLELVMTDPRGIEIRHLAHAVWNCCGWPSHQRIIQTDAIGRGVR